MAFHKASRSRFKDAAFCRLVPLIVLVLLTVLFLIFLLRDGSPSPYSYSLFENEDEEEEKSNSLRAPSRVKLDLDFEPKFPKQTELSVSLEQRNRLPPRNFDLFPKLAKDHIKIVMYVHNRPKYLRIVVRSLSNVQGIGETLLIVSHHWWWMMNTVWDGLSESKGHRGHILFIEEDHFIFPNAYRNIQLLTELKPSKCPDCYAANLAPSDVNAKGEGWANLIAEKIGNIGYTFNRTVWRKIHAKAKEFCSFDEYNWDITMWATVYPSFGSNVFSLRGPRRSAAHFGKCGLHQGKDNNKVCIDDGAANIEIEEADKVPNIRANWPVHVVKKQGGYQAGFKGWGGWGDKRDHELCLSFAYMYHLGEGEDSSR